MTHVGSTSAFTFASIEGPCPDSSSGWNIFDYSSWKVKDVLSATCLDFVDDPSLIRPILPCK